MPELSAWRVDKAKWARSSFDGAGAATEGGRWNSAGIRVVYASANLAMAAQEKYVHLPKPVPDSMQFVKFRIRFDAALVTQVAASKLPANWRVAPPTVETQKIGDDWALANESAVLAVPSAIIPEEVNYLLNPAHPDFKKIVVENPSPFTFDYRMARLSDPR
jgi:RES domain-containing protein